MDAAAAPFFFSLSLFKEKQRGGGTNPSQHLFWAQMWAPIHECLDRLEALRDPHAATTYRNASSSLRSYYGALERLDRLYRGGPGDDGSHGGPDDDDGVPNNENADDEQKLRAFYATLASQQEQNAIVEVRVARSILARQKNKSLTVEGFNQVTKEDVKTYFAPVFAAATATLRVKLCRLCAKLD